MDEFTLLVLEVEDFFFNGAAGDELVTGDDAGLADPVSAIGGLGFDCRVPPGIEVEDSVGRGEIEAHPTGFEADQEDGNFVGLELLDDFGAVGGAAVEICKIDVLSLQTRF